MFAVRRCSGERSQRSFQKQQAIFNLDRKPHQALLRGQRRPGRCLPLAIERAVMAGTKKAVVLRLPMDAATQVRANTRQGQKVAGRCALTLPGDHDSLPRGRGKIHRRAGRKVIRLTHKQPAAIARAGRIRKAAQHCSESAITGRQARRHSHRTGADQPPAPGVMSLRCAPSGLMLRHGPQLVLASRRHGQAVYRCPTAIRQAPRARPFLMSQRSGNANS